jgi:hypothetical protein
MYLAGSAQVNCKVLKRCNCPGLGLKCLSSVADVWFLYTIVFVKLSVVIIINFMRFYSISLLFVVQV